MNKPILTGNIGAAPVLRSTQNHLGIGGVRFFHDPDDGSNPTGGQGGQGHQQQQQQNPGGNGQQQQQQQQQDPFAAIDLDLLDDATRASVEQARAAFQQTQTQARDFQSRYDRLVAETQQGQQQQQQTQQRQQQQQQPTFQERLEQIYITKGGMPPAQAKAVAALNAEIFGEFSGRVGSHIEGVTGPLAANVAMQGASNLFQDLMASSPRMQNPDVAERVWQAVEQTIQNGGQVDAAMIDSLSKIYYVDITESQGYNAPQVRTPMHQPQFQQQVQQQGSTRYTFPGAGHMIVRPMAPNTGGNLDPETAAAVNATKAAMGKAFHWNTPQTQPKITRGGMPSPARR